MINRAWQLILILFVIATFWGCSLPRVALDQSSASRIKTIGMPEIRQPMRINVENLGGAGGAFGLVGGLVQAAVSGNHSQAFRDSLSKRKVPVTAHLRDSIENELKAQYKVRFLEGQIVRQGNDAKGDYAEVKTDANAILNVWITQFGYISPPSLPEYVPFVVVRVRLLDNTTRQELHFKTYTCGYEIQKGDPDFISSSYHYPSFGELMTSFDEASQGLLACETGIARLIGQDLKR